MNLVSNQPPTEEEFRKLVEYREKSKDRRITIRDVMAKISDIKAAKNYTYEEDEFEDMLLKKRRKRF